MHGPLSRVLNGTKNIKVHSTVFTHLLYKAGLLSFTYVNIPSVVFNPHYTNLFFFQLPNENIVWYPGMILKHYCLQKCLNWKSQLRCISESDTWHLTALLRLTFVVNGFILANKNGYIKVMHVKLLQKMYPEMDLLFRSVLQHLFRHPLFFFFKKVSNIGLSTKVKQIWRQYQKLDSNSVW